MSICLNPVVVIMLIPHNHAWSDSGEGTSSRTRLCVSSLLQQPTGVWKGGRHTIGAQKYWSLNTLQVKDGYVKLAPQKALPREETVKHWRLKQFFAQKGERGHMKPEPIAMFRREMGLKDKKKTKKQSQLYQRSRRRGLTCVTRIYLVQWLMKLKEGLCWLTKYS